MLQNSGVPFTYHARTQPVCVISEDFIMKISARAVIASARHAPERIAVHLAGNATRAASGN
jgi:hypothetical protein